MGLLADRLGLGAASGQAGGDLISSLLFLGVDESENISAIKSNAAAQTDKWNFPVARHALDSPFAHTEQCTSGPAGKKKLFRHVRLHRMEPGAGSRD